VVALNVKTGRVIWDHMVADHAAGFNITGGPLVAKGKVMQGVGGRAKGGNFIAALDARTGEEAWRFYTIARPGESGGNTWNGLELEKRNGASVWTAGSYDPDLNLAFFGVAQTYDTGPLLKPVNQPGMTNEGLYTDCTLAINPDSGKLVSGGAGAVVSRSVTGSRAGVRVRRASSLREANMPDAERVGWPAAFRCGPPHTGSHSCRPYRSRSGQVLQLPAHATRPGGVPAVLAREVGTVGDRRGGQGRQRRSTRQVER